MKIWELKFEIFFDASNIRTTTIKANTKRKAIILGTDKIKKETGWDMPNLVSCKEVTNE